MLRGHYRPGTFLAFQGGAHWILRRVRASSEYTELASPAPGAWALALWQAYDPANKVDLHATAVAVAGGGLYFVDPIPAACGRARRTAGTDGRHAARPACS